MNMSTTHAVDLTSCKHETYAKGIRRANNRTDMSGGDDIWHDTASLSILPDVLFTIGINQQLSECNRNKKDFVIDDCCTLSKTDRTPHRLFSTPPRSGSLDFSLHQHQLDIGQ